MVIPAATDLFVAVEDSAARAAAVAVCWCADDVWHVLADEVPSISEAWSRVRGLAPGTTVLCGVSLKRQYEATELAATGVGQVELRSALPLVAELLRMGRLRWDGDELDHQVQALRVKHSGFSSGVAVAHGSGPTHCARAAAWAVQAAHQQQSSSGPVIW